MAVGVTPTPRVGSNVQGPESEVDPLARVGGFATVGGVSGGRHALDKQVAKDRRVASGGSVGEMACQLGWPLT